MPVSALRQQGRQRGFVAVDLVVVLRLADPAVVERVFQGGEGGTGVLFPLAVLGAVVEGARVLMWLPAESKSEAALTS